MVARLREALRQRDAAGRALPLRGHAAAAAPRRPVGHGRKDCRLGVQLQSSTCQDVEEVCVSSVFDLLQNHPTCSRM